jgi:hypothetical protein
VKAAPLKLLKELLHQQTLQPNQTILSKPLPKLPHLLDPTGNFVSAHKNVPKSASLSSVCNTTSGAECKIVFTNGSTSKSLDPQTTDSNGSSFWNSWSPEDIGLTSGSWQVQAVATLNGQSKTSTDAMKLEIQ